MISELGHINTDEAFVRMRTFSRAHNEKLTEVATRIVNRQLLRPELPELFYSDPPL
jgi:AmiR/NasT family two-component response regulator